MKTVCAFANQDGGSILIGVDDDESIVGIAPGAVPKLRDQLTQLIDSWVEPRPPSYYVELPIAESEKVVLELRVHQGATLYVSGRLGATRTPYVRHHGITRAARQDEIVAIIQTRGRQFIGPIRSGF